MPAREPIRMRRAKAWNVEVENAYRFQCAGWRSAEEYAQGEYGDEISWFSDSGLVEKVQNRQGLFMYFKRWVAASAFVLRRTAALAAGRFGRVDGVVAGLASSLSEMTSTRTARTRVARRHGECLDKYLPRVKIFEYANDGGHK